MSSSLYAYQVINTKGQYIDAKFELRKLFDTDRIDEIEIGKEDLDQLIALNISLQCEDIDILIEEIKKGKRFLLKEEW